MFESPQLWLDLRTHLARVAQAVEQFLVERAVLPIENSLGVRHPPALDRRRVGLKLIPLPQGSIHRNYDLLLRHRLHIVGEVRRR